MIIRELHIGGFGKWRDATFQFAPGLNLFVAPNEAGKTTLLQAIISSLYGMKRDYIRVTRYLGEYEQYYPWDRGAYQTVVRYTLDGRTFRLQRHFEKERELAKLFREPELAEITREYQEDRRKEYNFIERHLGLNRSLFTDVTWVKRQPLHAANHLLPVLLRSEEKDPIVQRILSGLEQELAAIGKKESAETTLLGKAGRQLGKAQERLQQAEAAWQAVSHLTAELMEREQSLQQLQKQQSRLWVQLEQIEQAEQHWQQWWQRSFETKRSADFIQWEEAASDPSEGEMHRKVRESLAEIEAFYAQYQAVIAGQEAVSASDSPQQTVRYLSFQEIPDAEWQSWLKTWYAYCAYEARPQAGEQEKAVPVEKLQADFRRGLQLHKEAEELREESYRLQLALAAAERDDRGRGTGQAEQPADAAGQAGAGQLLSRTAIGRRQRQAGTNRSMPLLLAGTLLSALITVGLLWYGTAPAMGWISALLTILLGGAAARLLFASPAKGGRDQTDQPAKAPLEEPEAVPKAAPVSGAGREELSRRLARCESEQAERMRQLAALLAEWNVPDWEAFLVYREKQLAQAHRQEAKRTDEQEMHRLRTQLEMTMIRWGIPPHLPFAEAAALVLQERQMWEQMSREQQERLEKELSQERLRAQLAAEWDKREQERGKLLAEWEESVRRILEDKRTGLRQLRQETESELRRTEEQMVELREKMAQARGEIGRRGEHSWAKAKSEYDEALQQVDDLLTRREALQLAKETLQSVLEEWHRDLSPDVNQLASEVAARTTGGRYQDVRLDPNQGFAIHTAKPGSHGVAAHSALSSGTQDQLYFAQRVALLRRISAEREPLPLFLDDHFIHYDEERLAHALAYVMELAEEHQIFLFSCQERERRLLAPYLENSERHMLQLLV
ncbi:ATP-binding protein [Brevibacillus massiliensis]|uniref:ATP-binding protein n=1 Tax=Brevibacillus massiliensis TaxID=1118054 RepID=UPI0002E70649|nr:AAA family ATPase [Brevibacillus massiliensis]